MRKANELANDTNDQGKSQQLHGGEVVDLTRAKDLLGGSGGQKSARDENRDGGAEIGQIQEELRKEGGKNKAGEGDHSHVQKYTDETGDGSQIDEDLADGQLDVRSLAGQDGNSPGPDEQVEADVEESRQEQALGTEQ